MSNAKSPHEGGDYAASTRDIIQDTFVTCPSGRITEMRAMGVPIISVGQKRYPGAHAFECYAIKEPKTMELPRNEKRAQTMTLIV